MYGLLGEHLSHSWSPQLHKAMGGYDYDLFSVPPEELAQFLRTTPCLGLNVTIPYKKAVIPYCTALSPLAQRLGSVNTLLRTPEGFYGDNTDYPGFLLLCQGVPVKGAKAAVLGTGGAGVMAAQALRDCGAQVELVSRRGECNYETMSRDVQIIVNATPVGMYPKEDASPIDLSQFPDCHTVIDLIYHPLRTRLILDAMARGLRVRTGLSMLVEQARLAAEKFTGRSIEAVSIFREMENIVLIGMPGSGKTTIGKAIAEELRRPFFDADEEFVKAYGDIPTFFRENGEAAFRARETEILRSLGQKTGIVLATGGGAVTIPENYPLLKQNGKLFWIQRPISDLPVEGRPVSMAQGVSDLCAKRLPLYEAWADSIIENTTPAGAVHQLMEEWQ